MYIAKSSLIFYLEVDCYKKEKNQKKKFGLSFGLKFNQFFLYKS